MHQFHSQNSTICIYCSPKKGYFLDHSVLKMKVYLLISKSFSLLDRICNFEDVKAGTFWIGRDSGTSTTSLHAQPCTGLTLRWRHLYPSTTPVLCKQSGCWTHKILHVTKASVLRGNFLPFLLTAAVHKESQRGRRFSRSAPHAGRALHGFLSVMCGWCGSCESLRDTKPVVDKMPCPPQLQGARLKQHQGHRITES